MKKLTLSQNKKLAGVCGGIAEYLDVDPTVVRLIWTCATLFTCFAGFLIYIIFWIVVPKEQDTF